MSITRSDETLNDPPDERRQGFIIMDGEINFLWSFIQGSLMNIETWWRLLRSYGFCERHAWIHLGVEMAFRERYVLGPTILYGGLIEQALNAVDAPISRRSAERRLRSGEACLLCALNVVHAGRGACPEDRLRQGRNMRPLQGFAVELMNLWSGYVCGACKRQPGEQSDGGGIRCRRHFLADVRARRPINLQRQQDTLRDLHSRIIRYQESFTAGKPQATDQDRASLVAAVGWCSGWRPLLALLAS